MKANYHTHTKRCGHAFGEDREFVEAAIEAGLEILGFADHGPWVYKNNYRSGIRLTPAEVDAYFYSLENLRREYKKDIQILIGFESEHLPMLVEDQTKLLRQFPIDYMIQGQHFLGPDEEQVYMGAPFVEEKYLEEYVRLAVAGIESGRYLYLAHPDLPNFLGSDEVYRKHMFLLCEKLKEYNMPAELNVLGMADRRHYPAERFWEMAKEVGNTVILGIDAHTPEQLLNKKGIEECEEWAKKYGLEIVESMEMPQNWL